MKKRFGLKIAVAICLIAVTSVIVFGTYLWYNAPKTLLKNVPKENIGRIEVFNGSTGNSFTLEDSYETEELASIIKNTEFHIERFFLIGDDGYSYSCKLYDKEGMLIDSFIINRNSAIFSHIEYTTQNGSNPHSKNIKAYDYLAVLEEIYCEK